MSVATTTRLWLVVASLPLATPVIHRVSHCPSCFVAPHRKQVLRRTTTPRLVTEKRTRTESPRDPMIGIVTPKRLGRPPPEPELVIRSEEGDPPAGSLVAGAALASSAIIAEGVQIAGTASLLYLGQQYTGSSGPVETVSAMIDYLQSQGGAGYAIFAAAMIFFQVVPIAAAFVLTVSAGAIFGAVKGTALVLTCSTASASISFLISRSVGRDKVLELAKQSPQYQTLDAAFASASFSTSLTLITLLRLSPVLPFSWANYVFGLSGVPWTAFSLGTFLGCAPAVAAYVSTGQLGAEIVVNGAETNPALLALGIAATIGAVTVSGNIASQALQDMDVDLSA